MVDKSITPSGTSKLSPKYLLLILSKSSLLAVPILNLLRSSIKDLSDCLKIFVNSLILNLAFG